jgi:hypothetical protein
MLCRLVLLVASFGAAAPDQEKEAPKKKGGDVREVQPEVGDLSGYYTCKGQEAGGKYYSGVALLIKKNDLYLIQWVVSGGSTFSGVAIRQGDTLAASWAIPGDRGVVRGVNVYRVESGPRLIGRWASLPGPGVLQSETLSFLKKLDPDD